MTLIQFKLNNYDYSSENIEQVKDYIKNKIFPEYVKTSYKRKLYENKWKGFITISTFYKNSFTISTVSVDTIFNKSTSSPSLISLTGSSAISLTGS